MNFDQHPNGPSQTAEIGRNKTRRVEIYIVAAADTSVGAYCLAFCGSSVPKQTDERLSSGGLEGAGGSTGYTEPYLF